MSEADIDAFRTELRKRLGQTEQDRQFARFLSEVPAAEVVPAYSRMQRDRAGNLWLAAYRQPGHAGPHAWTVLNSDGRWLGEVNMPDGLQVWDIGDSHVLGVFVDENDVEYVHLYALTKSH